MNAVRVSEVGNDNSDKQKELLNLSFDSRLLATIESTRTVLGIIQSPLKLNTLSLSKSNSINLNSTRRKENRISLKTLSSPFTDRIYQVHEDESFNSEIENVDPKFPSKETTTLDEYDAEHTIRIQCERKIEKLQELSLAVEQENAVLKLDNHKKEKEIRTLTETLNKIKENWKHTEDYVCTVTEHHSKLQEELEKEQNLNSTLAKEMSDLIKEFEILKETNKHAENKYKIQVDSLHAENENMKRQLEDLATCTAQYKKDIQNYQGELFTLEKEKQNLTRFKVKIESEYEEKLSEIKTKLSETIRINAEYKTKEEKTVSELLILKAENETLAQKIKDILNEKDSLEVEFRKSEAFKVVQEVENSATIKKILSEKENEFEEFERQFSLAKCDELEKQKSHYKTLIENLSTQHRMQIENFLQAQEETNQKNNNSLKELQEEIIELRTKIRKLESGRNRVLSKLQVHLQNQWRDSVQLLYEEDDDQSAIPNESFEMNGKGKWLQNNNVLFDSPSPLRLSFMPDKSMKVATTNTQQIPLVNPNNKQSEIQNSFSTPHNANQKMELPNSSSRKLQHYIKRLLQEKSGSWPCLEEQLTSPAFEKREISPTNSKDCD